MARQQRSQPQIAPTSSVPGPTRGAIGAVSVVPWIAFWGWVALDSALAYRQSQAAIERVLETDPINEIYDGPPIQRGLVSRWLLWSPGTLSSLRAIRKRARASMIGAPVLAVLGPLMLSKMLSGRKR